jgi:hypothetical protein
MERTIIDNRKLLKLGKLTTIRLPIYPIFFIMGSNIPHLRSPEATSVGIPNNTSQTLLDATGGDNEPNTISYRGKADD